MKPCIYFTFPLLQAPYCSCAGVTFEDADFCSPYSTLAANDVLASRLEEAPFSQGLWLSNTNSSLFCPDSFGLASVAKLKFLTFLSVKSNRSLDMPDIPIPLFDMQQLRGLQWIGTGLTSIPINVTRLSKLEYLDISNNMIATVLPVAQAFLETLRYPANATGNPLCNERPPYLTC